MLVKDLRYNNKGIFAYMLDTSPEPLFLENISSITSIDLGFYLKYGDRQVPQTVIDILGTEINDDFMKVVANLLLELYKEKWENLHDLMVVNLQLTADDYKMVVTENVVGDETSTDSNTRTSLSTSANKVAAYDSSDYSEKDQKAFDGNETNTGQGTKINTQNRKRTTSGLRRNPNQNIESAVNYLRNNLRYDIVYTDVSYILSSLIY